jgi:hypothetical protein
VTAELVVERAVVDVRLLITVAIADEQYALSYAMTLVASEAPQAALEQSRTPYPKLTLLQRQEGSGVVHPRLTYCAITLLKQVWPQEGRELIAGSVELALVDCFVEDAAVLILLPVDVVLEMLVIVPDEV